MIVGVAAALLGATAETMGDTVRVIEIVSYGLIVLIGARLVWVKGRALLRALLTRIRTRPRRIDHHDHAHAHHGHDHAAITTHDHHDHGHAHTTITATKAMLGGTPMRRSRAELKGRDWWKRGLSAIVAVGLRPCSGAIIVLVFALAQGLFWVGVAATFVMGLGTAITVAVIATLAVGARGIAARFAKAKPGAGMIVLRGLETLAAVGVLLFGVLLLTGYMYSERLM